MKHSLYIPIHSSRAGRIDPGIGSWATQAALDELHHQIQAMKPMRVPS